MIQASLTKEEEPSQESSDDVMPVEKVEEEAIEIKDVDDALDQSDNESVVEVVDTEKDLEDAVEVRT